MISGFILLWNVNIYIRGDKFLQMLFLFSCWGLSDYLWPHGLQHDKLPCPSPSPGVFSNSCPFSRWCNPTTSSSVTPFSSWPQSFPASGSFPMNWHFASSGQSIEASASVSALLMNIQDWFPLGLTGLFSFCLRDSQESSPHHRSKASIL